MGDYVDDNITIIGPGSYIVSEIVSGTVPGQLTLAQAAEIGENSVLQRGVISMATHPRAVTASLSAS